MGGGSSDSGSGDTTSTIRYAPYIEDKHKAFLNSIASSRASTINQSPFSSYNDIPLDDAFFGANYIVSSFPALYDMFGKFMAGLDIDALADQIFNGTVNSQEVSALVSAESDLLQDEIDTKILPPFEVGLRDINAVNASSFIIGRANIMGAAKIKSVNKFSSELKYRLIPIAEDRWKTHLSWNEGVVSTYMQLMKLYFSAAMDIHSFNHSMTAKNTLWPFTVLDYERAALGALQGARSTKGTAGSDTEVNHIGAALSGASAGTAIGGAGWGTAIGAGVGLVGSFF